MDITLNKRFARDGEVNGSDVRQIKKALNRLGYYLPPEKLGITDIPDAAVFEALRRFQRDHHLKETGMMLPGDDTVSRLNEAWHTPRQGVYRWRSAGDEKVRPAHAMLDGTLRPWSDAPDPGEDFNCRCWAEPVINDPPIEPVYPELLLPPLAGVSRLYHSWQMWQKIKNSAWTLGKYKSNTRWGNQLRNRNWTPDEITETIRYGKQYKAPNYVNPGNPAVRYEYGKKFIVRDETTKEILQLSGEKFSPNKMP